jgi:hypothetical protein
MSDTCRSCDAPVLWVETSAGRKMPLDPEPVEDGNVVITAEAPLGLRTEAVVLTKADLAQIHPDRLRYRSHFSTCPHADQHRRPRHAR